MSPPRRKIFIIAGESSGDLQASLLIEEIKRRKADIELAGLGGPKMAACGTRLLEDLTQWAAIGLVEVLKHYFSLRRIFYSALQHVKQWQPDLVILVDYPGFNIRFAKKLKGTGIPVLYYISPQVWAWGRRRIRTIARVVDRMLAILPFEPKFYAETALAVEFVGHPLIDQVQPSQSREVLRREWNLNHPTVALLSGSRLNEVRRLLPVMLEAVQFIRKEMPDVQLLVSESPSVDPSVYDRILQSSDLPVLRIRGQQYDTVTASDLALVASGTATLETALCGTPFIILYKVTWSTYWLGRALIQIPYIGLVNVVAQRKAVPEYLQHDATPQTIGRHALFLLRDTWARQAMLKIFQEVRQKLGPPGAAGRAAQAVLRFLDERPAATIPVGR